jgi:hypothetical protein
VIGRWGDLAIENPRNTLSLQCFPAVSAFDFQITKLPDYKIAKSLFLPLTLLLTST